MAHGWTNATLRASLKADGLQKHYKRNYWAVSSRNHNKSGVVSGVFEIKKLDKPDLHYQCAYNLYPEPIDFAKVNLDGDCRDLVNLNAVHLILRAVLDPAAVWGHELGRETNAPKPPTRL
jgi:hypothetical protein